jgi:hypothetical protein
MEKYYYKQDDYSENSRESVNGDWMPLRNTSSFDGFEFSDDYDNFNTNRDVFLNAVDPVTAAIETAGKVAEAQGKTAEALGKILASRNERKIAETKLAELGGKRSAQLSECENNPAYRKFADPKYRRNRINDCQAQVNKRMDAEELEQRDIIRKSLEIEQSLGQAQRFKTEAIGQESKTKKYAIIIGGVLIALYLASTMLKKKKK